MTESSSGAARAMSGAFRRRIYARPAQLWDDVRYLLARRGFVRRAMRELLTFDFRERLMMVVTEVNGCRYCSYYHVRESRRAGIPEAELRELLAGTIPHDAPADELPALLYAREWAEHDARPPAEADAQLAAVYGAELAEAIGVALRLIRIGNLLGNTGDYLVYRATFGRAGLRRDEARYGR